MSFLRSDCPKILTHLIQKVVCFCLDTTHPVHICFTENLIASIDDFESLEINDIDALTYHKTDDTTNITTIEQLPPGNRGNLKHLIRYVKLIIAQYF